MSLINILIQDNSMIKEDIISSKYEGQLLDNTKLEIPEIQLIYGDEDITHDASMLLELNNELNVVGQMNLSNQVISIEKQEWNIDGHRVSNYVVKLTASEMKLTKNDLFIKPDLQYVNNLIKLFNQRNDHISQTISYRSH